MPALKYAQQEIEEANLSYSTSPIKKENTVTEKNKTKNPHISKEHNIFILNTVLLMAIGVIGFGFMIMYSLVALKETKLASLHSKINELNYENIELENKLENVKSYYSVDDKVAKANTLDKAKKIIEINKVDRKEVVHHHQSANNLNTATGF